MWVRMVPPSYEVRASMAPPVWWDFVVVAPTTDPQLPLAGWWVRARVSLLVHKAAMRSDGTWPLRPLGSYHYEQWSQHPSVLISGRGHHLDPKSELEWASSRLGFAYPAGVSGEKPEAVFLRALRLLADTRREARDRR